MLVKCNTPGACECTYPLRRVAETIYDARKKTDSDSRMSVQFTLSQSEHRFQVVAVQSDNLVELFYLRLTTLSFLINHYLHVLLHF